MSSREGKRYALSTYPRRCTGLISLEKERTLWDQGLLVIAGVDEAGRGPLAGPVVVAAVVFSSDIDIPGIDDSKKLSPVRRECLSEEIMKKASSVGIAVIPTEVIDEINIFQATMKGMAQAVASLRTMPDHVFVDGPHHPPSSVPHTAIIAGDATVFSIAAASIIAKVTRDRIMVDLHREYPEYGFQRHKGYGTPEHLAALRRFGPCGQHRKSFHMPQREDVFNHEQSGPGNTRRE